ncbi:MAG: HAD family hydrolase [Clostridiales bacterium]|nr:HAD family hydrolase [Clostridiales bacterium]
MVNVKGVVFDLDHTLFDRYATLAEIMKDFVVHFDVSEGMTAEKAAELITYADKHFVHFGWDRILAYLTEKGMFKTAPSLSEYSEYLLDMFTKIAVPYPFTKPTLKMLRENGIKTGLITNGRGEVQRAKLRLLGLDDGCFDEIIISGEFGKRKPSPEPFLAMAERLGFKPEELMYVGDHPIFDVDASRKAGYIPVWVMTTGTWVYPETEKPDIRIENVSALPEIIGLK